MLVLLACDIPCRRARARWPASLSWGAPRAGYRAGRAAKRWRRRLSWLVPWTAIRARVGSSIGLRFASGLSLGGGGSGARLWVRNRTHTSSDRCKFLAVTADPELGGFLLLNVCMLGVNHALRFDWGVRWPRNLHPLGSPPEALCGCALLYIFSIWPRISFTRPLTSPFLPC